MSRFIQPTSYASHYQTHSTDDIYIFVFTCVWYFFVNSADSHKAKHAPLNYNFLKLNQNSHIIFINLSHKLIILCSTLFFQLWTKIHNHLFLYEMNLCLKFNLNKKKHQKGSHIQNVPCVTVVSLIALTDQTCVNKNKTKSCLIIFP